MIRLLMAFLLANATTAGLFSLMALMVGGVGGPDESSPDLRPVSVLMTDRVENVNRRERKLPEPPPPLPPMPQAQVAETPTAVTALPELAVPDVGLTDHGGVAVAMPSKGMPMAQDRQAMPMYRVDPVYPQRALSRKTEGYVIMAFTIDEQGRPQGIRVIESQPKRIFDKSARKALSKWKYQPKLVDGKAVPQPGQTAKLEFRLQK